MARKLWVLGARVVGVGMEIDVGTTEAERLTIDEVDPATWHSGATVRELVRRLNQTQGLG